jgi:hypothetical protein
MALKEVNGTGLIEDPPPQALSKVPAIRNAAVDRMCIVSVSISIVAPGGESDCEIVLLIRSRRPR